MTGKTTKLVCKVQAALTAKIDIDQHPQYAGQLRVQSGRSSAARNSASTVLEAKPTTVMP
mgnify:CR=1 FL=1